MTSEEKRNHALKSLERRFELAKTGTIHHIKDFDSPMTPKVSKNPHTPSSKGSKTSFSSKRKSNDENEWTYARLGHQTDEKLLLPKDSMACSSNSVTQKILHDLLQHGDHGRKYMQGGKTKKLDNWILLDTLVKKPPSCSSYARALQAHSKRSKKRMSMRQHKKLGTLHLPPDVQRYDLFFPLHEKWKDYMAKLIKISGKEQLSQSFLNADLHGAMIYVADCKIRDLKGICGIMIRETAETMGIITRDDKFIVVVKRLCVFMLQFGDWKVTLYGDKLISRSLTL